MTLPTNPYEIVLYDHHGVFVDFLQGWSYLDYSQRVSLPWNAMIRFDLGWDDPRLTMLRAIQPDDFIIIHRTHWFTFAKATVYEGVHQTRVDQAAEDGHIIITLYSQGYTSWLNRRVVVPGAGVDQVEKTGAAETIIKQFVDENMVTVAAPRVMPGLNIAADAGAGNVESYSARYTNLETVVQTIAEDGAVEFGIVGTNEPPTLFQFQVRPIWGTDRRINAIGGGTKMFFNFMSKNEDIPILSTNYSEQKTVVYVGGQGQGNLRTMLTLSNATALAESPRARKEAYVDAFGAETNTEMLTQGKKYLSENARIKSLTFNMRQQDNVRWYRDFWLGDIVTAKYFDHIEGKEIKEIHVVVDGSQGTQTIEHIDIELEDLSYAKWEWIQEWTTEYTDPYPFTDLPGEGWLRQGLITIGAFTDDKKLWITTDFDSPAPAWIEVDLAAVTGAYFIQFAVDPWSPKYMGTGTQVNGWILTDTNVFKIDDIFGIRALTDLHNFGYSTSARNIDASFGTEGHVAICTRRVDVAPKRVDCDWTDDKGVTWNNATVLTYVNHLGADANPGCFVSSKTAGLVFTSCRYSGWHIQGYRSLDYGATWAATTGAARSPLWKTDSHLFTSEIHIPWEGNADEDILYFAGSVNANADDPIFYRTTVALVEDISPQVGGLKYAPLFGRGGVSTAPLDRLHVASICRGPHTWDAYRFFTSLDGGDTWTDHGLTAYDRVHIAGDNASVIYTWGDDLAIGYSTDFGATIQDKRGNMAAVPPATAGRIQYIVGG